MRTQPIKTIPVRPIQQPQKKPEPKKGGWNLFGKKKRKEGIRERRY
jgi:hypothetical protein